MAERRKVAKHEVSTTWEPNDCKERVEKDFLDKPVIPVEDFVEKVV